MRYVYLIRNLVNNKVYVGQTKNFNQRKYGHRYAMKKGVERPLYRAMRKYGFENFTFEVLEECTDESINEREQHWVVQFDSFNPERGYNLTSGGNQDTNVSEETKRKLSESLRGKSKTDEHKRRISDSRMGWEGLRGDRNPNHRRVIEGRPLDEKTRALLSACASKRVGEKNANAKLTIDTVRSIKFRLRDGATVADVVREFCISRSQVNRIRCNQQWQHVTIDV